MSSIINRWELRSGLSLNRKKSLNTETLVHNSTDTLDRQLREDNGETVTDEKAHQRTISGIRALCTTQDVIDTFNT